MGLYHCWDPVTRSAKKPTNSHPLTDAVQATATRGSVQCPAILLRLPLAQEQPDRLRTRRFQPFYSSVSNGPASSASCQAAGPEREAPSLHRVAEGRRFSQLVLCDQLPRAIQAFGRTP